MKNLWKYLNVIFRLLRDREYSIEQAEWPGWIGERIARRGSDDRGVPEQRRESRNVGIKGQEINASISSSMAKHSSALWHRVCVYICVYVCIHVYVCYRHVRRSERSFYYAQLPPKRAWMRPHCIARDNAEKFLAEILFSRDNINFL